jgi:hypothetical protein
MTTVFNNVSTYGKFWRLMREGKIPDDDRNFCELALKILRRGAGRTLDTYFKR